MKKFNDLVAESAKNINEIFPWDLEERFSENPSLLLLDIREPYEYEAMHIKGSLNVPRGVLETACEWDFEETVAELVNSREKEVILHVALVTEVSLHVKLCKNWDITMLFHLKLAYVAGVIMNNHYTIKTVKK